MADIASWSPAAASNNAPAPNGFPENMPPGGVNDSSREVMAAVRRWYDTVAAILNTGSVYAESRSASAPEAGGYYIDGLIAVVKGPGLVPGALETWWVANPTPGVMAQIVLGNPESQVLNAGSIRNRCLTVAELPAASANRLGDEYTVTNALGPTYGAAVVGGGFEVVGVMCDGVNWRCR